MKFKWNVEAFEELRNDPAVMRDVMDRAQRIAAACGPGFEARQSDAPDPTRARAYVSTATAEAMRRNATEHTLLSNLDAGR